MIATLTLWALVSCYKLPDKPVVCSRDALFTDRDDCAHRLAHAHWYMSSWKKGERENYALGGRCEAVEVQEVKP